MGESSLEALTLGKLPFEEKVDAAFSQFAISIREFTEISPETRARLVNVYNAPAVLVAILKTAALLDVVVENISLALSALCKEHQDHIVKVGSVTALLKILETAASPPDTIVAILSALRTILTNNDIAQDEFYKAEGVKQVVQIMARFPNFLKSQELCCFTLAVAARSDRVKLAVGESEALSSFLMLCRSKNDMCLQAACSALKQVALLEKNCFKLSILDGVAALHGVITGNRSSVVVSTAIAALRNLCNQTEALRTRVAELGTYKDIARIVMLSSNMELRKNDTGSIDLDFHDWASPSWNREGHPFVVANVLALNEPQANLQFAAADVIWILGKSENLRRKLVFVNIMERLTALAEALLKVIRQPLVDADGNKNAEDKALEASTMSRPWQRQLAPVKLRKSKSTVGVRSPQSPADGQSTGTSANTKVPLALRIQVLEATVSALCVMTYSIEGHAAFRDVNGCQLLVDICKETALTTSPIRDNPVLREKASYALQSLARNPSNRAALVASNTGETLEMMLPDAKESVKRLLDFGSENDDEKEVSRKAKEEQEAMQRHVVSSVQLSLKSWVPPSGERLPRVAYILLGGVSLQQMDVLVRRQAYTRENLFEEPRQEVYKPTPMDGKEDIVSCTADVHKVRDWLWQRQGLSLERINVSKILVHTEEASVAKLKESKGLRLMSSLGLTKSLGFGSNSAPSEVAKQDPSGEIEKMFLCENIDIYIVYYAGAAARNGGWCFGDQVVQFDGLMQLWKSARQSAKTNATARLLIIADCCFSGAWVDNLAKSTDPMLDHVAVQAACGADELAYEDRLSGGCFTRDWLSWSMHGHSWKSLTPPPLPPRKVPHPGQRPKGICKWDAGWKLHPANCLGARETVPTISVLHAEAYEERPAMEEAVRITYPDAVKPAASDAGKISAMEKLESATMRKMKTMTKAAQDLDVRTMDLREKAMKDIAA